MTESRSVASLVVTQGRPGDLEELVAALEDNEGISVTPIDDFHADISIID